MIVLSEYSPQLSPSASAQDLRQATEAARLVGCQVYHIPQDFSQCETAENALAYVPTQEAVTPAVWVGYIPTPERYAAIYEAALGKRIVLVNAPEQHLRAQEFDRAYPFLKGLTPDSLTLTGISQCEEAVARLALPLFVKGAVQSRKSRGWRACVAENLEELRTLCAHLLSLDNRSRGRIIARQLVSFRHSRISAEGFPLGREYRIFVYHEAVLGYGYYWEGDDPLKSLSPEDEARVLNLARLGAERLGVPYVAVDVGQLEDGAWTIVEAGDAQFSGVSQTPLLPLWHALSRLGGATEGTTC